MKKMRFIFVFIAIYCSLFLFLSCNCADKKEKSISSSSVEESTGELESSMGSSDSLSDELEENGGTWGGWISLN